MKGRDRQTLADVTLEQTGSIENIFNVARSHDIGLDKPVAGIEFEDNITDKKTVTKYKNDGVFPATENDVNDELLISEDEQNITDETNSENIEI